MLPDDGRVDRCFKNMPAIITIMPSRNKTGNDGTVPGDAEIINWFHDQERTWMEYIKEKNNPCYKPMLLFYTSSRQSGCVLLEDGLTMGLHGKDIARIIVNDGKNGEVLAIGYYFHMNVHDTPETSCSQCPVHRHGSCEARVTIINFHLFTRSRDEMLDHVRYHSIFFEGEKASDDKIEIKKCNDEIVPDETIARAFENPFFHG
jgi:hypothetical protein